MFKYFISYQTPHNGGVGRCEIVRDKPITGIADIEDIERVLARETVVVVTNWQRFPGPVGTEW